MTMLHEFEAAQLAKLQGATKVPDFRPGDSVKVSVKVVEGEPPGLYRGPVELSDGRVVPGILFDEAAAKKHPDITEHGGWRGYLAAGSPAGKSKKK